MLALQNYCSMGLIKQEGFQSVSIKNVGVVFEDMTCWFYYLNSRANIKIVCSAQRWVKCSVQWWLCINDSSTFNPVLYFASMWNPQLWEIHNSFLVKVGPFIQFNMLNVVDESYGAASSHLHSIHWQFTDKEHSKNIFIVRTIVNVPKRWYLDREFLTYSVKPLKAVIGVKKKKKVW